jgi:hypothetical protein
MVGHRCGGQRVEVDAAVDAVVVVVEVVEVLVVWAAFSAALMAA